MIASNTYIIANACLHILKVSRKYMAVVDINKNNVRQGILEYLLHIINNGIYVKIEIIVKNTVGGKGVNCAKKANKEYNGPKPSVSSPIEKFI